MKCYVRPAAPIESLTTGKLALDFMIEENAAADGNPEWQRQLRAARLGLEKLKERESALDNLLTKMSVLIEVMEVTVKHKTIKHKSIDSLLTEAKADLARLFPARQGSGPEPAFLKELRRRSLVDGPTKTKAIQQDRPKGIAGDLAEAIQSRPQAQIGLFDNIFQANQAYSNRGKQ